MINNNHLNEGEEKRALEANSVEKLEIASLLLYGQNIIYKVVPFKEGERTTFLLYYFATDEVHDDIECKFDTFCRGIDCFIKGTKENVKPIIRRYTESGELDFTVEDLFEEIKKQVRTDYGLSVIEYETWVSPMKFYKQMSNKIFVIHPHMKKKDIKYVKIKYENKFHDTILKLYDENYEIEFISPDDTNEEKDKEILKNTILKRVAETYDVDLSRMLSVERNANLVEPRQVAMYLLKEKCDMSYKEIAKIFHKKDYTTVMHGISKIQEKIKEDKNIDTQLNKLCKNMEK